MYGSMTNVELIIGYSQSFSNPEIQLEEKVHN